MPNKVKFVQITPVIASTDDLAIYALSDKGVVWRKFPGQQWSKIESHNEE